MVFEDGASPPTEIITRWLDLVEATFLKDFGTDTPCIAVHCVAGLGRFLFSSPNFSNIIREIM